MPRRAGRAAGMSMSRRVVPPDGARSGHRRGGRVAASATISRCSQPMVPGVSPARLVAVLGRHHEGSPHGRRRRHPAEGAADQPRPALVRHVRRDRRRPGGGALVLPRRRRGRAPWPSPCRPTTWRSATRSTARPTATSRGPAAGDARPRVPAQPRAARRRARRRHGVLRLRRHRGRPQLSRRQRVPRLDGREVPVAPARRAQPDHPARADARRRGRRCSRRRSASSA